MSYQHSLNAEVDFKPGVTIDQVFSALIPLSEYFGWKFEDILKNNLDSDHMIEITANDGVIQHLSLYTDGDVSHSFPDLVDAFAGNLHAFAEPGSIELRDHDTGDLENAIYVVWYGNPIEVTQLRRLKAWQKSTALLRNVGTPENVLDAMASIGGFESQNQSAEARDVEGARLFWTELLDSVETLTAIADIHGPRTLADLFYLQNAILCGGFVDHYPGESKTLDIAKALPSGERWTTYIKVEALLQPLLDLGQFLPTVDA